VTWRRVMGNDMPETDRREPDETDDREVNGAGTELLKAAAAAAALMALAPGMADERRFMTGPVFLLLKVKSNIFAVTVAITSAMRIETKAPG